MARGLMQAQVTESEEGIRLDRWFKRHYPALPHAMLEKYLRKGQVRLSGAKARAADRLSAAQDITFPDDFAKLPRSEKVQAPMRGAEEAQRWVIHKDNRILALNKPAGLAVQGGSGQARHLDGMLDALRFGASERPRLVHRLDKDTSGVLLLARDAKTAGELAARFAGKGVEKRYLALVRGSPKPSRGTIDLPLAKLARGKDSREAVDVDQEEGKRAVTRYRVIEALAGKLALVEMEPVTGRTHQLRVHMAAIGHPILGDGKYGGREAFVSGIDLAPRLHLHAHTLALPNWHGKNLALKAKLPPHMRQSLKLLGMDFRDV